MAQKNVTIAGASYTAVPAVDLPVTGGGTARFTEVSDTTAVASDVAQGKYFYNASGVRTAGTASGGSDFVVMLSYNSTTQQWEPDKTFAEISQAYSGGKTIIVVEDSGATNIVVDGYYDDDNDVFTYCVVVLGYPELNFTTYTYNSEEIVLNDDLDYIYPLFETVSKTYTPTTSTQTETVTFDSTDYNGLQQVNVTVNAVTTTNLSANNILSGVTVKVGTATDDDCIASVTGNVVVQNYYTGSAAPSSGTGNNGDLYLQT